VRSGGGASAATHTGAALSAEDQRALPSAIQAVHTLLRELHCLAGSGDQRIGVDQDSALAVVLRAATHHVHMMRRGMEDPEEETTTSTPAAAPAAAAAATPILSLPLLPVSTPAERHAARLPQLESDAATGCGRAIDRLERYRKELQPPPSAEHLRHAAQIHRRDEIDEEHMDSFGWALHPDRLVIGSVSRVVQAQSAFSALIGRPLVDTTPIGHVFTAARHVAATAVAKRTREQHEEEEQARWREQNTEEQEEEQEDEEEEEEEETKEEEEEQPPMKRRCRQGPGAGCPSAASRARVLSAAAAH